ncbi:MAG: hypothetical protein RBR23_08075 [Arcobacteraceae bacterium]|jgi:hypothetical protein|nr:hypothetical protein [Arcobacteraceae bacterium]
MGLKKYIFFSLLLIIAIAGYVFSLNSNDFRLEVFGQAYVLPIAVWVVMPVVVLFILSLLHMLFYGTKAYFEKNAFKKDFDKMSDLITARLSAQEFYHSFKTNEAKEVSNTLNQVFMTPSNAEFSSKDKSIQELASKIIKINAGEYVPTKELKLSNTNPLMEKNLLNKLKVDGDFCLEVLKKSGNFTDTVVYAAGESLIKNKSITTVKKNLEGMKLDKQLAFELFKKDSLKHESFSLSKDEINKILSSLELTKNDFIELAKIYKKAFGPDEIIKFFEDLSSKNEEATSAYLYVLFEYEMLDNVREVLANSANDEYVPFKALLDLRNSGKHYRLDNLCFN